MDKLDERVFSYEEPQPSKYGTNSPMESEHNTCENCHSFDADSVICTLFRDINEALPEEFDIQEGVSPDGYCKAFQTMEKKSLDGMRRKGQQLAKKENKALEDKADGGSDDAEEAD